MLHTSSSRPVTASRFLSAAVLVLMATTASGQVIDAWLVAGPIWGRGAGAALSNGHEARLAPAEGDHTYDFRTDQRRLLVWEAKPADGGWLDFFGPGFPHVEERFKDRAFGWAGAAMYAVKYIESDRDARLRLEIESPQPVEAWLNGEAIEEGATLGLVEGWNRLVVKIPSPSKIRNVENKSEGGRSNWSFRVGVDGGPARLTFADSDPDRELWLLEDGQPLRVLATLGTETDKFPVFEEFEPVRLPYRLEAATGPAENYAVAPDRIRGWPWVYTVDPGEAARISRAGGRAVQAEPVAKWRDALPDTVEIELLNYDHELLEERSIRLRFAQEGPSDEGSLVFKNPLVFGDLPVGHYTLVSTFRTREGKVWARDNDHSFAVVRGPVDTANDTGLRYLGNIGHHLGGDKGGTAERIEWLHKIGVTRQFKLLQSWSGWGASHDGEGNVKVERQPRLDFAIRHLRAAGITPVGDLIVGSGVRKIDPTKTPALTAEDQEAARVEAERMGVGELPVIQPPGAKPLPVFGTAVFEKTVYDYAFKLVSAYKDDIRIWSGMNEIDLHAKGATGEAEMLAAAQKIAYRAAKDADPDCVILSPSLVRRGKFVDELLAAGFADGADVLDVHAHPANTPRLGTSTVLGNSGSEGIGSVRPFLEASGIERPIWFGELSAPLAHSPRGVAGQAEAVVKQLCWAIGNPRVEAINYLVMYNSPSYWGANLGFNNFYGEPHPAVNAVNAASHLIDGRARLGSLSSLPEEVSHLRFAGDDHTETVVLWSDRGAVDVNLRVSGEGATVTDVIGRSRSARVDGGRLRLRVDVSPVYVNADSFRN